MLDVKFGANKSCSFKVKYTACHLHQLHSIMLQNSDRIMAYRYACIMVSDEGSHHKLEIVIQNAEDADLLPTTKSHKGPIPYDVRSGRGEGVPKKQTHLQCGEKKSYIF